MQVCVEILDCQAQPDPQAERVFEEGTESRVTKDTPDLVEEMDLL